MAMWSRSGYPLVASRDELGEENSQRYSLEGSGLGVATLVEMNGSSLSTKLLVALAGQALFSLVLQLLAIIVPPAMLLLSVVALRSPRRSIQASVIAQLLVCLVATRFLVPELLHVARGEDVGWAGRLFIVGSAPVVLVSLTFAAIFYHHLAATCNTRNA